MSQNNQAKSPAIPADILEAAEALSMAIPVTYERTSHIIGTRELISAAILAERERGQQITYRDYHIRFDPPPIPTRAHDWQWVHDDYDGAPDGNDNRCGSSASVEQAKADIDEQIADTE